MKHFKILLLLSMTIILFTSIIAESVVPAPAVTRTELRVAKSLNPDDTQTLNVMTRDGNVAQLIVKRRDAKSKLSTASSAPQNVVNKNNNDNSIVITSTTPAATVQLPTQAKNENEYTRSFYSNWIPVHQSVYLQPNLIRLDTFALVKNSSEEKSINNNIGSVVSSDRIPHVPKPVTIRSGDIYIKPPIDRNMKKGRSLMEIDSDGIPVVHGVRVPDDESDEKVWRNARVINGELIPYEKGYKPPAAVPLGQLVYASTQTKNNDKSRGIGPFTTVDNFPKPTNQPVSFGPFTVKDNKPEDDYRKEYVKISSSGGFGPFTVADNSRKLIDYIKEINDQESKRDYFSSKRKFRSYETENYENAPQIQRRMLQYNTGTPSYPNSAMYSPPSTRLSHVNFNEGVRTPILQYAHPELGVQPAKATPDDVRPSNDYESGLKENDVNHSPYDVDPSANEDLDGENSYNPQNSYYTNNNNMNSVDFYKKSNYPYTNTYYHQKSNQPFWIRITESIKDNVQSGFERMHQLTRPVFDPIVEATHKITHNLGLAPPSPSPQRAQEKVGFITPVGGSIILPALGLVAGGAALGLGAAAVGRFLQPENMRAINGMGYHHPNDILLIMEESNNRQEEPAEHRRLRRSLESEEFLQELTADIERDDLQHLTKPDLWTDTPCAKKLFCDVMVRQDPDEVVIMEKKMDSLLGTVHPTVIQSVSHHLQEVIDAVKRRDCSEFICAKRLAIPLT